ncbi:hypothetical protein SAMD00019534_081390, partial [Acytostelium subglobosum LB1]|uniref:hypothetical protein n=1 Tax=Acytostelium subglobosum LB1 TaxID=1410327 RepID=UPI000644A97B
YTTTTYNQLYSLDMRNHGNSMHSPEMKIDNLVEDLSIFLRENDILKRKHNDNSSVVLVGHSVGGKVAMLYSLKHQQDVDGLVCADVAPTCYVGVHNHSSKFEAMLKAASIFNDNDVTRSKIEDILESYELDKGNRLYLMNNLVQNTSVAGNNFRWRVNLRNPCPPLTKYKHHQTLYDHQDDMLSFPSDERIKQLYNDMSSTTHLPVFNKPVLFVGGNDSHYLRPPHTSSINKYFPNHQITFIPGGHFAHVQSCRQFTDKLVDYLNTNVELLSQSPV